MWKHWKVSPAYGREIAVERRRSLTAATGTLWKALMATRSYCGKAGNVTAQRLWEPDQLEPGHARVKSLVPMNGRYATLGGCFQARARSCPQPRARAREYQRPLASTITRVGLSTGIPRADAGFSTVSTECAGFSTNTEHRASPAQTREQTPVRLELPGEGGRQPVVWCGNRSITAGFDTPQDARI